ncbi:MAG: hypothetical protein CR968_00885 [Flavobacteriia bacterium]|nr:MAG: hypothetical protein CR968_00885 [Flavobacteriia bacterium]
MKQTGKTNEIQKNIRIGQQIFENIPSIVRPNWAGLVLSRFDRYLVRVPSEITELYEIIENN